MEHKEGPGSRLWGVLGAGIRLHGAGFRGLGVQGLGFGV